LVNFACHWWITGEMTITTDTLHLAAQAQGLELGTRRVSYDERDVILYALAVGAQATDLELVFERDLRVLPTFVLPLGLWACDALGDRGFFSSASAVHGAQRLEVLRPLPPQGTLDVEARVIAVWDKGSAAVFEIEVSSEGWRAVYSIFAPGRGGWGGERGPGRPPEADDPGSRRLRMSTSPEQAVLYRLTGDRHLIHVEPEAARAIGQPRPIMHGLCTLGFAARELPGLLGAQASDLAEIEARFSAPVFPGDRLELSASEPGADGVIRFSVCAHDAVVLDRGSARLR
jgi:acyl dehydratase